MQDLAEFQTLESPKREGNITKVYTVVLPQLLAEHPNLTSAITQINAALLQGVNPLKLYWNNTLQEAPNIAGVIRNKKLTQILGAAVGYIGTGSFEGQTYIMDLYAPGEAALPVLLDHLQSFEQRLSRDVSKTVDGSLKKGVFVSLFLNEIHPFYDGNGRTSRVSLPYLLLKDGATPRYIESSNSYKNQALKGKTIDLSLSFLWRLYQRYKIFPAYVKDGTGPISPIDIFGHPEYSALPGNVISMQKQCALESLLLYAMKDLTLDDFDQIFKPEEKAFFETLPTNF